MTILEALSNALEFMEAAGYKGGDIHNNMEHAIKVLKARFPKAAAYQPEDWPWEED